jgi:hypothetical protein
MGWRMKRRRHDGDAVCAGGGIGEPAVFARQRGRPVVGKLSRQAAV